MWNKAAKITIGIIGIFSLALLFFIKDLKFDYNFENFFPIDDPDLNFYQEFRAHFESDNDYLLIGIENEAGIFQSDFLVHVDQFSAQLALEKSVISITSPTRINHPILSPAGYFEVPLLHVNSPARYASDSIKIYTNQTIVNQFFSQDGKALILVLRHPTDINKKDGDQLLSNIRQAAVKYQLGEIYIAGRIFAQNTYIDKMQYEMLIFLSVSLLFVVLFLVVTYRSVWNVLVPITMVVLSVIWLMGFMGLFNKPLDLMLVVLPSIMFVVAMSDVVHILTKYIEELRFGHEKTEALKLVIREVGIATFLTSFTTAIGFLTLLTSNIKPIREFGIYAALGVLIAYILAFTLFPALLVLVPKPKVVENEKNRMRWLNFLTFLFRKVMQHSKSIVYIGIAVLVISIIGITRIEINTQLLEDIPNDDPLKVQFDFFEKKFGGSRPLEIALKLKDSTANLFDDAILKQMDTIEQYIIEHYKTSHLISPLSLAKSLNQTVNGGLTQYYRIPANDNERRKFNRYLPRVLKNRNGQQLISAEGDMGRITGRMNDIGSKVSLEKNEAFYTFVAHHIDTSAINIRITGTSLLIDKSNQYLSRNMLEGLLIAFFVVAVITALLFYSIRMIVIVLIPNIIPLLMIAAFMGFAGITLKLSTAIIFTIAFGIAVDDTIHFISKLRLELSKGTPIIFAIRRTYITTGKAIIITTLILVGGFISLLLSSFGGTFYMGVLVGLTLLLAVIIDLTLLPALLILFYKKNIK